MGAARKPPQKQQTTSKPPEVPRAITRRISPVFRSSRRQAFQNLVKMSTTTASESSGRIPQLKTTTTAVSSSTSSATATGHQTSSLLVSQHPLLCSLLSSPSPQQLVVTP